MIIFIRRIPVNTIPSDLHDFVSPALRLGFLRKWGHVVKAEIMILEDIDSGALEFHGLVHVDSDTAGRQAIQKLNGKLLNGKRVIVREYHPQRSWRNDRRHDVVLKKSPLHERRFEDRRRGNQVRRIHDYSIQRAYASLHKHQALARPEIEHIEITADHLEFC